MEVVVVFSRFRYHLLGRTDDAQCRKTDNRHADDHIIGYHCDKHYRHDLDHLDEFLPLADLLEDPRNKERDHAHQYKT